MKIVKNLRRANKDGEFEKVLAEELTWTVGVGTRGPGTKRIIDITVAGHQLQIGTKMECERLINALLRNKDKLEV